MTPRNTPPLSETWRDAQLPSSGLQLFSCGPATTWVPNRETDKAGIPISKITAPLLATEALAASSSQLLFH